MVHASPPSEREVEVALGDVTLDGSLRVPADPRGVVVFAHGRGSGRFSRAIARWRPSSSSSDRRPF
jgi:hypothetical protein